jgi:hypothetical protein
MAQLQSASITGSFTVITGSAIELQVTNLGVNMGSALTDSHIISGSVRINPNGLFVSGSGAVGIGITTPGTRLTVYAGSGSISGTNDAIRLQVNSYNNAARNTIVWGQDSSDLTLGRFGLEWSVATSQMNFVWRDMYNSTVGSTELMRLTGGGNLGIGTTSPGVRLVNSGATLASSPTLGSGTIGANAILSANGLYGLYTGVASEGWVWQQVQRNDANSSVYSLVLQPSGGNVGIGTTTPDWMLRVEKNTASASYGQYPAIAVANSNASGYSAYYLFNNITNLGGIEYSNGESLMRVQSAGSMLFLTGGSERMRITSGGQVLIGQTAASGTTNGIYFRPGIESGITVTSDVALQLGRLSTTGDIQTFYSGTTRVGKIAVGSSTITFESNASGGITVNSSGLVGINTSSPTSRLSVCSTTACSTVVNVQGCAGQLFSVTDNLVGDIFSVSDISGIPILNVNSNGTVCVDSKIAVGVNHTVSGAYASVTGGRCNTASGGCSTIGGGVGNTASGYSSVIAGGGSCGFGNIASGTNSFIGGGKSNVVNGVGGTVSGGRGNTASNYYSTVSGGCSNCATGSTGGGWATVGGGFANHAAGIYSTVIGGLCNAACGSASVGLGGSGNSVTHNCSAIANCNQNTASACEFRVQNLSKQSGTFRIDHPDPAKTNTHNLSHSFVESPNAGDNIYRYKVTTVSGQAIITLPSYYKYLNKDDQIWVTPQGHFGVGYGEINAEQTQLTIYSNTDGEYNVLLIGTRKDQAATHHWQGVETYK